MYRSCWPGLKKKTDVSILVPEEYCQHGVICSIIRVIVGVAWVIAGLKSCGEFKGCHGGKMEDYGESGDSCKNDNQDQQRITDPLKLDSGPLVSRDELAVHQHLWLPASDLASELETDQERPTACPIEYFSSFNILFHYPYLSPDIYPIIF